MTTERPTCDRLRSTRERLRAFPVPNAAEKSLNPEWACLKAEEAALEEERCPRCGLPNPVGVCPS